MAEQSRADLTRVGVERGQHRFGIPAHLPYPLPGGLPVAVGQGDQAGEERGDDPGPRVGVRVDALACGDRADNGLAVVGHKKIFLTGIVGFAAASAAVGLSGDIAKSISLVIAFRVAQGAFGAMLQPTALALLRKNFPAEKLNAALGIWGAVIGASTAAGPIVGGLLVQHVNWEACFYINIPVGLIALAMGLLVLRETDPSPAARSFDIPGIALLTTFLFALLAELTQAQLAEAVGVTRQTIVAVEAGDYAPSVYLALAIPDRLGVTVEELFGSSGTASTPANQVKELS